MNLIALLGGIRAAIFAGVAVLLLTGLGVQTWRLHSAQTSVAELEAAVAQWDAAQTTNLGTIEVLRARLASLAEARRLERQRQADAVSQAQAAAQAAQRALQARTRALEATYASDPDAARWGNDGLPVGVLRQLPGPD